MTFKSFSVSVPKLGYDDLITDDLRGVYLVYKKNCIAQFSFDNYQAKEALDKAYTYLNNRKDKADLRIEYIPRVRCV